MVSISVKNLVEKRPTDIAIRLARIVGHKRRARELPGMKAARSGGVANTSLAVFANKPHQAVLRVIDSPFPRLFFFDTFFFRQWVDSVMQILYPTYFMLVVQVVYSAARELGAMRCRTEWRVGGKGEKTDI